MGIEAYRWGPTNQRSSSVGWSELQPLLIVHNSIGEISLEIRIRALESGDERLRRRTKDTCLADQNLN